MRTTIELNGVKITIEFPEDAIDWPTAPAILETFGYAMQGCGYKWNFEENILA